MRALVVISLLLVGCSQDHQLLEQRIATAETNARLADERARTADDHAKAADARAAALETRTASLEAKVTALSTPIAPTPTPPPPVMQPVAKKAPAPRTDGDWDRDPFRAPSAPPKRNVAPRDVSEVF